jgi:hypothetical protein
MGVKQQTANTYLITTLGVFLKHSLTKWFLERSDDVDA